MKHQDFCEIQNIPEVVTIDISPTMKLERLVAIMVSYKRLGIEVFNITGNIKKLNECPEILKQLSKDVSIFVENSDVLDERVKRYIENAYN